jgi:hypothetical protein
MRTRGGRVRVPREDDRLSTASAPGSDGVPRLFAAAKLRSWFIRSSISVWLFTGHILECFWGFLFTSRSVASISVSI